MPNLALVVMAAGTGSRYGGLKQIEPIGPHGEIILDYSVYDALIAGFDKVVFIIREDIADLFRDRVGRPIEKHADTTYVFQRLGDVPEGVVIPPGRKKPWGTGHAILSCREVVGSPFAVINADDFYGRSSYQSLSDFLKRARDQAGVYDLCMVGFVLENTLTEHGHVSRGICTVDEEGFLKGVSERTRIERAGGIVRYAGDDQSWVEIWGDSIVSLNMWGFTPGMLYELEAGFLRFLEEHVDNLLAAEYFLPDLVAGLLREKRASVKVLPTTERWLGVTYRKDVPRVKQAIRDAIRRGIYPENLWE